MTTHMNETQCKALAQVVINAAVGTRQADESVQAAINKAFASDLEARLHNNEGDDTDYKAVLESILDQTKGKERVKNDAISMFTRRVNRAAKQIVLVQAGKGLIKPGTVHVPNMGRKTHKGIATVTFGKTIMTLNNKAKSGKPAKYVLEMPAKPATMAEAFRALNDVLSHVPGATWEKFKVWADNELAALNKAASQPHAAPQPKVEQPAKPSKLDKELKKEFAKQAKGTTTQAPAFE